ncbi:hypothetical protein JVT61DRAFT_5045 [Boletus reticuloceps]|uniref:non-specific serine/threonine protein kinase n=1 Tax=Boletus reticuloceps TaxID=495285 RepID=A0A8I3AER1_9AGAM|nr:hypothetical protein JVT61DRAFT_5045 [Boletus reticuloceps]
MHSASATHQHVHFSKKNFKTVLGFGALSFKDVNLIRGRSSVDTFRPREPSARASVDTSRSYHYDRKSGVERSSITDLAFFESRNPSPHNQHAPHNNSVRSMKNLDAAPSRSMRRPPFRIDAQEGPWSISVAETPHEARSYSIYIKSESHPSTHPSPIHALHLHVRSIVFLSRVHVASESIGALCMRPLDVPGCLDMHPRIILPLRAQPQRWSSCMPNSKTLMPHPKSQSCRLTVASLPQQPAKRKSTFLNTLSRLASPSTNKVGRQLSVLAPSSPSFGASAADHITSPSHEIGDPFTTLSASSASIVSNGKSTNTTMTALAAYLTTISNEPSLRQTRAWKRFVHVRTDDLQSVRAERAIKRVRSDLAAHISSKADVSAHPSSTNVSSSNLSEIVDGIESINDTVEGETVSNDLSRSDLRGADIKEEEEEGEATAPSSRSMVEQVQAIEIERSDDGLPDDPPADDGKAAQEQRIDTDAVTNGAVEEEDTTLPTPVADTSASRIPRSHSADPDKGRRLSRVYTSSTLDGTSSATGDESSISTTARRARKKRSQSNDPSRKKKTQRKVAIDDFEMMRVLGKGCAGKVLLVRQKTSSDLYALKAITKRHVLAHQELQHTLTEQAVLKRMAKEAKDPFVVKLWWSFHDKENLFLVMDFHPGGDLATQLARWGRLGRDRARFYAAEIVEGVEGLHMAGVIYRDLKPENILIGADGHIVLTDFGLSKEFPRRATPATAPPTPSGTRGEFLIGLGGEPATPPWMKGEKGPDMSTGWPAQGAVPPDTTTTFCGTAEYLAPEVIQGLPYSYEVDWWSFGTMLYEMLTGITPFWANNHSDMYVRVLQDELQFPEDRAMDQDTKSLIRGLLQRNPALRICEPRIKRHPYFSMIDWSHVYYKRYIPPYIPPIDPSNASDTQNFDDTFLDMEPVIDDPNDQDQVDTDQDRDHTDGEAGDGEDAYPTPSHSRSPSVHPDESGLDVFDGYSFKGRHSVIIDDEDEDGSGDSGEEETDEEDMPSVLIDMLDSPAQPPRETEIVTESPISDGQVVEPEPKTPEARPQALVEEAPEPENITATVEPAPYTDVSSTPRTPEPSAQDIVEEPTEVAPPLPAKDTKPKVATKVPANSKATVRNTRGRREKSGIPALDRFLSDGPDEDGDMTEKEEDDDWDIIEADGEDRNGTKGTSLFARGVVDRYRLAVFRKASTPSRRVAGRSVSGLSKESDLQTAEVVDSPSPSEKRRGRAPGLKFRKTPQFLKGKSPPSSFSAKSASTIKTSPSNAAASATISSISSNGLLTPSVSAASTMAMSPSLRSKESAVSVGNQSQSSDQSNGETAEPTSHPTSPEAPKHTSHQTEEPEKLRSKKLKKYKENAEKMLSLFASQR